MTKTDMKRWGRVNGNWDSCRDGAQGKRGEARETVQWCGDIVFMFSVEVFGMFSGKGKGAEVKVTRVCERVWQNLTYLFGHGSMRTKYVWEASHLLRPNQSVVQQANCPQLDRFTLSTWTPVRAWWRALDLTAKLNLRVRNTALGTAWG